MNLSVARTAFSLTGGSGTNSASWNPTLSVLAPASVVAGTYTATTTHSVARGPFCQAGPVMPALVRRD